jgi:hypothetical protein
VLDRIVIVRRESLKRLDDDIDILKTFLKAEDASKAAMMRSKPLQSTNSKVGSRG